MADGADIPYAQVEQELAVLMRRARAYSQDLARQVHPELHAAAYAMLGRLLDLHGARSSELSEFFGIDKGAVSRQVKLLEDLGLVSRAPDPQDGRAQQLVITEKGRERVTRAREERHRLMRRLLEPWEAGDVRAFAALLARFNGEMNANAAVLVAPAPRSGRIESDLPEGGSPLSDLAEGAPA